jgi:hypothetical protein
MPLIKRFSGLSRLREIDVHTYFTSYVREIEMLVERSATPFIPQYPIQFWRDVSFRFARGFEVPLKLRQRQRSRRTQASNRKWSSTS